MQCDTVLLGEWLPTFVGLLGLELKPLRSFETPETAHPKTQCHACVPLNPHIIPCVGHEQLIPNSFQFITNQW